MNENIQNLYNKLIDGKEYSREELMNILNLSDRKYVQDSYIKPLIDLGLLILKYPDKPNKQKPVHGNNALVITPQQIIDIIG